MDKFVLRKPFDTSSDTNNKYNSSNATDTPVSLADIDSTSPETHETCDSQPSEIDEVGDLSDGEYQAPEHERQKKTLSERLGEKMGLVAI